MSFLEGGHRFLRYAIYAFLAFFKMHHPTCISKKDWESSLVYEKLMCRLHIRSSRGGGSAERSIYSTFCKRETERCLQQQHPPV